MMMEIVLICIIAYYVVGLRMWFIAPFVPAAPAVITPAVRIEKVEIITSAYIVKRPVVAPACTRWQNRSIRLPWIRDGTKICLLNHWEKNCQTNYYKVFIVELLRQEDIKMFLVCVIIWLVIGVLKQTSGRDGF